MGCGKSNEFRVNSKYPGQDTESFLDFQKIGLEKRDINGLFKQFCKFDIVGDGTIELAEFTVRLNLSKTNKVARIVFHQMDRDGNGVLNFREFVLCVWIYLMRTKESLANFTFDIFDTDDSGSLTRDEILEMISYVYGTHDLSKSVLKIIHDIDTSKDGRISKYEFVNAAKKYPALLFPAFEMQDVLRSRIMGDSFWEYKLQHSAQIFARKEVQELFSARTKIKERPLSLDTHNTHTNTTTNSTTNRHEQHSQHHKANIERRRSSSIDNANEDRGACVGRDIVEDNNNNNNNADDDEDDDDIIHTRQQNIPWEKQKPQKQQQHKKHSNRKKSK
eukprot:gene10410-21713_t